MTAEAESCIDNNWLLRGDNGRGEKFNAAIAHYRYMLHLLPHFLAQISNLFITFLHSLISGHRRPTDLYFIDSGVGEETPLSAFKVGGGHR
jgi:hypothetical protein